MRWDLRNLTYGKYPFVNERNAGGMTSETRIKEGAVTRYSGIDLPVEDSPLRCAFLPLPYQNIHSLRRARHSTWQIFPIDLFRPFADASRGARRSFFLFESSGKGISFPHLGRGLGDQQKSVTHRLPERKCSTL